MPVNETDYLVYHILIRPSEWRNISYIERQSKQQQRDLCRMVCHLWDRRVVLPMSADTPVNNKKIVQTEVMPIQNKLMF